MSYSRWSNSSWYSFWSDESGEDKSDQVLCLWYSGHSGDFGFNHPRFSYAELKEFDVKSLEETLEKYFPDATEEEIIEATVLISVFIEDVDETFEELEKETQNE